MNAHGERPLALDKPTTHASPEIRTMDEQYRNPMRDLFEDLKRKHPQLAKYSDYALGNLNDVDPTTVLAKLPPAYPTLWHRTFQRAQRLVPLIQHAIDASCFIESLILCHGLIQIVLRTLYVSAWQRSEDRCLSDHEIKPYFEERKIDGSLHALIGRCAERELIEPEQAALLLKVNSERNRAAHGVMTGEIEPPELAEAARQAQWAALGALERLQAWFNNPCKFYWKRDGVPFHRHVRSNPDRAW